MTALGALFVAACGVASEPPLWTRPGFYGAVRPEMGPPQPGSMAKELDLPAADGTRFVLSQQRGAWVVLHFTATWCPFCDTEVEHLGQLASDYAARGVKVVLVDLEEDKALWAQYRAAHVSPALIALWDRTGEASRVFAPRRAQPSFTDRAQVLLAATLIIDRHGTIRLFVLPDSKHFDPTFAAERGELARMLAEDPQPADAVLPPERVLSVMPSAPLHVHAGESGELTVQVRIAPGYHVMSDQPSAPQYIATRIAVEPAADVSWNPARFPASQPFRLSDRDIATFTGALSVVVPFHIASGATAGPREIKGSISYQACTEGSCLFPTTKPFAAQLALDP